MKSTVEAHRAHPWRVHALAADFEVIDVWRFELRSGEGGFDRFLEAFWSEMAVAEKEALSRLRLAVGKMMGWDSKPHSRPIPGCIETSVANRLTLAERSQNRYGPDTPSPLPAASVKALYRFGDEALYEVSNDTVHALLHLGLVPGGAELAVYVKSRGALTRFYMAAIWPFRRFWVYPRLIGRTEARHAGVK